MVTDHQVNVIDQQVPAGEGVFLIFQHAVAEVCAIEFNGQTSGLPNSLRYRFGDFTLMNMAGIHGIKGVEYGDARLFKFLIRKSTSVEECQRFRPVSEKTSYWVQRSLVQLQFIRCPPFVTWLLL